ncbi:unannotated protein [freshwater metagenome]|uniref:Unannotated protein n=1 Tax=freshwater metagenome TaxID=449393 RepID=A0A6J7F6I5_9ZZZZ
MLMTNDFVFKDGHQIPSWLSGVLSDVAGLFALPVVLISIAELSMRRLLGWRFAAIVALGVGVVFAAAKLSDSVADVLTTLWTWTLTPISLLVHGRLPRPVGLVHDPTDLVALVAAAVVPAFVAGSSTRAAAAAAAGESKMLVDE